MGTVASCLVMYCVARSIPNVVGPADKRIENFKKLVELASLKHRSVLKLMNGYQSHKRTNRTVNKQTEEQKCDAPIPIRGIDGLVHEERQRSRSEKQTEMSDGLNPSTQIMASHEPVQRISINR